MLVSIFSLLLSVALLMIGHGIQSTLIPVRAELEAFSGTAIGFISASFYAGFVLGGLFGPYLIVRAGHIRAFAALISLASASALAHPLFVNEYGWFIARLISGFCIASNYLIVESWLNEKATNQSRGLVMSTYTTILSLGIIGGQLTSGFFKITAFDAFVLASIALSLAVVPVSLTKSAQPAPIAIVRFRPLKLYQTSPAAIMTCILDGVVIGALFSLLPLYASRLGFDGKLIPIIASSLIIGGLILQYPLGRLSDKMDRRILLVIAGIGSIVLSFIIAFYETHNAILLIALITALGSLTQPIYAIAVAHAYDHTQDTDSVETASGILLAFGLGSIIGPIAASIAMHFYGEKALFLIVGFVLIFMVLYLIFRIMIGTALSDEDKSDYDLASGAIVGGVIAPELYEGEDDYVLVPQKYDPEKKAHNHDEHIHRS